MAPIKKSYPKYAAIYIPSKDRRGKNIDSDRIEKAVQIVQKTFRSLIGGSTTKLQERERIFADRNLTGEFDPATGDIAIREEVTLIYGYFSEEEAVHMEGELTKLAEDMCRRLDQYAIGIILDNEFHLVERD
jgi:hypothetical protein